MIVLLLQVMDPTYIEEEVMCGRMTVTLNANGDICAIQKPGEEGVNQSVILHCLRLASSRAAATTKIIRDEVTLPNPKPFEYRKIHIFVVLCVSWCRLKRITVRRAYRR